MRMRRWLALVLASALAGCYVDPYPDDPFDPNGVTGAPDFQLDSLTGPSALSNASLGVVQAQLCNRGAVSGRAEVSFFLSKDTLLDQRDALLATSSLILVPAGSCRDASAQARALDIPAGSYFLLALADPDDFVAEPDELNNRRVGSSVRVDATLPEQVDTVPPAAPVITEATWQAGTTQQVLSVKGTTEPGAEVGVFIDMACTGFPAATVFASATGTFSAQVTVPAASAPPVRRMFAAARDAALNESECVEGPQSEASCAPGFANCDGNPANGCEVNLTEDVNHCGTCSTSCQAQGNMPGVCVAGTCGTACAVGQFDCDGNPANGCESTTACSPATCGISRSAELAITALSVVEDPVRTAPGGAWSFGTLLRAMAGDQDPSTLVRNWLRTWASPQTINGITLPARPQMLTTVLGPWEARSGGANQPLDFSKAPFRLLAITNRMDLRNPGVQAGEGRFIFGVLDGAGNPLEFTLILEYALPGGSPEAIQRWAHDWHELGQLGLSHPNYNAKLQALTERFAKVGVMAGRPFGNALNQIRTNEFVLAAPWEMREFNLTETGLRPVTVKLTPELGFENSSLLGDYIRANQADILAERHVVPERFGGVSFLGSAAQMPEGFFWRAPGVTTEARHKFSLNTCNGCHAGETGTEFTHISPRRTGQAATLSVFMQGGTVRDPWTQAPRTFDDLGRRAADLSALVCGTGSTQGLTAVEMFGGFPASSNLPRARVH